MVLVWIPIVTAILLGITLITVNLWQERSKAGGVQTYSSRYQQLTEQLESITSSVNQMESYLDKVSDKKLLEYYESTLRMLETLLTAIRRIPASGNDPAELQPAFFLIKSCRERVVKSQKAFRSALRGDKKALEQILGTKPKANLSGCYFCSRPIVAHKFSQVKVKLDGSIKQVMSCRICREELESTKKVKVLYFMKDGQPVHWSSVNDYIPSEDYWNINKRESVRKTRHLELVSSRPPTRV